MTAHREAITIQYVCTAELDEGESMFAEFRITPTDNVN